ncbi:MAG: hypothetical protein L6371_00365 [Candidatus Atribacteria bacterium]|nr:hypothetical protein [Candidatus Atribacteria bacterium]
MRFFHLSPGEEKEKSERNQESKNKERVILPPVNSNLPGGSITRREKEYYFL